MILGKVQTVSAKKGKTVTPSRTLRAKGEMCTIQTGKLCYSMPSTSITYTWLRESSISHLSRSFVKEFAVSSYRWSCVQLCMLTREKSTKLWELNILRDRIVVSSVKSLNQGLWLQIRIHLIPLIISKRIKEILKQKHQNDAKYLSRFNDKNAFRK